MSRDEIVKTLNNLHLVYPRMFKDIEDPRRKEQYISLYTKYLGEFECVDVTSGIDKYIESEQGRYEPSLNDLINYSKAERARRLSKKGGSGRRIVTDDEWRYELYLNEMKKDPEKRNEWLMKRCLDSYEIMTSPEKYIAKHGKPREEFEAL